ncbi:LysM peptidoglycan-binding domain-containing protein [Patescibacteria group bacterium]
MEKVLKNWLKKIKLSESTISTLLGAFVIILVGSLIFNYFKSNRESEIALEEPEEIATESTYEAKDEYAKDLPQTHVVKSNDSLWLISEKYYGSGYNWIDIASENNLSNPDFLEEGMELKLPNVIIKKPVTEVSSISEEIKTELVVTESSITEEVYQVKKGDFLWDIAIRAYGDGYKWPEIAKANNLLNPDFLEEGMELKLPR